MLFIFNDEYMVIEPAALVIIGIFGSAALYAAKKTINTHDATDKSLCAYSAGVFTTTTITMILKCLEYL